MITQDGREMFELQLELHRRAQGLRTIISADEVLEVHDLLEGHTGDLKALMLSNASSST